MAKALGSYRGVWKQDTRTDATPELPVVAAASGAAPIPAPRVEAASPPIDTTPVIPLPPALLDHRYRLLLLQEHRHKLGRDLLEAGHREPWQLAWNTVASFGRNFRPWAHARTFALGCYLNIDMSPEILRQLRHPLHIRHYRRAMRGLWRLLELLAQKQGNRRLPRLLFRLSLFCPPLGILVYEKQLQGLLNSSTVIARENVHATT